jgi:hypothetical protein
MLKNMKKFNKAFVIVPSALGRLESLPNKVDAYLNQEVRAHPIK